MTKEELIKYANDYYKDLEKAEKEACCAVDKKHKEFVRDCIKALEQQPCDDAISRQAVEEIINDIRDCISVEGYCAIIERLKKLPPVTPTCEEREKGECPYYAG